MPYYVSLFLLNDNTIAAIPSQAETSVVEEEDDGSSVEGILQVFRIFKLARIFKLGRHSPGKYHKNHLNLVDICQDSHGRQTTFVTLLSAGLQSIVHTIRQSLRELGLMLMLILIAGLTFASLCYFIEENEDSGFTSIPTGIYWVVITMTTVGYGDIYPITGLGKVTAEVPADLRVTSRVSACWQHVRHLRRPRDVSPHPHHCWQL